LRGYVKSRHQTAAARAITIVLREGISNRKKITMLVNATSYGNSGNDCDLADLQAQHAL
jgi:hypothetical protein